MAICPLSPTRSPRSALASGPRLARPAGVHGEPNLPSRGAAVPVTPRDRAVIWLAAELANGPRPATELYEAAARAGIPDRTLERAKKELRVQSHRVPRVKQSV